MRSILGHFFLWVNYQANICFCDGDGYYQSLSQPEWPPDRRWKHCLGEIAVFRFGQQLSNMEVVQRIRAAGYMMGDIWCLVSTLKSLDILRVSHVFLCQPACIVAPASVIHDQRFGRQSPFVNMIDNKVVVDFVCRSERDWSGYWLPHWKFLAVRWSGEVIDDFWTLRYRPEATIITPNSLTFRDG